MPASFPLRLWLSDLRWLPSYCMSPCCKAKGPGAPKLGRLTLPGPGNGCSHLPSCPALSSRHQSSLRRTWRPSVRRPAARSRDGKAAWPTRMGPHPTHPPLLGTHKLMADTVAQRRHGRKEHSATTCGEAPDSKAAGPELLDACSWASPSHIRPHPRCGMRACSIPALTQSLVASQDRRTGLGVAFSSAMVQRASGSCSCLSLQRDLARWPGLHS